jgi:hypothetical protein
MHCSFGFEKCVIGFDVSQAIAATGFRAIPLHFLGDIPEVRCRLTVDPLSGEIPVIDPSCMTVTFEMLVSEVCPLFPQQVQKLARLQASILFLGETVLV